MLFPGLCLARTDVQYTCRKSDLQQKALSSCFLTYPMAISSVILSCICTCSSDHLSPTVTKIPQPSDSPPQISSKAFLIFSRICWRATELLFFEFSSGGLSSACVATQVRPDKSTRQHLERIQPRCYRTPPLCTAAVFNLSCRNERCNKNLSSLKIGGGELRLMR